MNIDEAILILNLHQQWRKGAEIPQQDVVKLGMAIDIILCEVKNIEKVGYCKGSNDAHKILLKTLYNEIEKHCEEHIKSGGLRFYGVSFAEIKQIFEVLGYKQKPKF